MTPGGPCFKCRRFTGRYDAEAKRWACSQCHPQPTHGELLFAELMKPQPSVRETVPAASDRLPGESRQEWRRRVRGGLTRIPPDAGREVGQVPA